MHQVQSEVRESMACFFKIGYHMTHYVFCFASVAGKLSSKLMLDAITILSQVLVSIIGSPLRDLIYF